MEEEVATQQQGQPVEQVTKTPVIEPSTPVSKPRQKDPKKVAAGKALARKNKEARQAAAKLKEVEESSSQDSESFPLPYDGILKASALVGAAFTLYHGWAAVSGELKKRFTSDAAPAVKSPPPTPPNTPEPEPEPDPSPPLSKGIDMD